MFFFSILRALIRYGATPAFLALAIINARFHSMGGHMAAPSASPAHEGAGLLRDPSLASMWLMYLLMALAHATPWLPKPNRRDD